VIFQNSFLNIIDFILGWPFIAYVTIIGLICTITLGFAQFRYFFTSWKATFLPERSVIKKAEDADMSPFQAFLGALNSSIGNGTIAGVATAIFLGGPGSIFWIFSATFLLMVLRFSEVYLSSFFSAHAPEGTKIGGPFLYIKKLGNWAPYLYALLCIFFGLTTGNTMQSNSINMSFTKTTGIDASWYIAIAAFLFVGYIILGGAARVAKASETLVPFKVGLFFSSALIIFAYHFKSIIPALSLIVESAFTPVAVAGGMAGFGIQYAIREGFSRSISTNESGLGTAGILFGSTGSTSPVKDGFMGMLSSFISSLACFVTGLLIVVTGVWNSGLIGTELASQAFETVFGGLGNWIVMLLSISFGMGVLVTYSYITREAWLFLTKGKYANLFGLIYCLIAFAGPLIDVKNVWSLIAISSTLMIFLNLAGILKLLPMIKKGLAEYQLKQLKKTHEKQS